MMINPKVTCDNLDEKIISAIEDHKNNMVG